MKYLILSALILAANLYGFAVMGYDKKQAQKQRQRVPEKRLFAIAFLGGGLGTLWGMRHFRHKTQHLSFRLLFPLAAIWCLALYFLICKLFAFSS